MSSPQDAHAPHPERVSEAYAEERINEKLTMFSQAHVRQGLENVSTKLKESGVPAAYRLHLITAVAHLGRVSEETLPARLERANTRP